MPSPVGAAEGEQVGPVHPVPAEIPVLGGDPWGAELCHRGGAGDTHHPGAQEQAEPLGGGSAFCGVGEDGERGSEWGSPLTALGQGSSQPGCPTLAALIQEIKQLKD